MRTKWWSEQWEFIIYCFPITFAESLQTSANRYLSGKVYKPFHLVQKKRKGLQMKALTTHLKCMQPVAAPVFFVWGHWGGKMHFWGGRNKKKIKKMADFDHFFWGGGASGAEPPRGGIPPCPSPLKPPLHATSEVPHFEVLRWWRNNLNSMGISRLKGKKNWNGAKELEDRERLFNGLCRGRATRNTCSEFHQGREENTRDGKGRTKESPKVRNRL